MIGPHGGKAGTVKIDNFTDHIPVSSRFSTYPQKAAQILAKPANMADLTLLTDDLGMKPCRLFCRISLRSQMQTHQSPTQSWCSQQYLDISADGLQSRVSHTSRNSFIALASTHAVELMAAVRPCFTALQSFDLPLSSAPASNPSANGQIRQRLHALGSELMQGVAFACTSNQCF